MPKGTTTVLTEIPTDLIKDAMKSHPRCVVDIRRTNEKGQWAHIVSGLEKEVLELLDIASFCQEHAGGGKYRIAATTTTDRTKDVVPPFYTIVEGPSRPYTGPGAPQAPPPGPPAYVPGFPPNHPVQQYYQAQPPRFGAPLYRAPSAPDPKKYQTHTPDQIALMNVEDLRHRLEAGEAEWRSDRATWEAERKRLEELVAQLREEKVRAESEHKEAMLELRIESIKAQKPQHDIGAILTGVAPIATALLQASTARQSSAGAQQTEVLNATMGLMGNMVAKKENGGDGMKHLVAALPAVIPLLKDILEARGPKGQAELYATMGDQMLTQASMLSQVMQMVAEMQPDQSPMAMLLQQIGDGVTTYAQMASQQLQGSQPQHVEVSENASQPQQVPAPEPEPQRMQEGESSADVELWNSLELAECFRTREWYTIVFHMQRAVAGTAKPIALMIAGHLENLERMSLVPPELGGVFDKPTEVLHQQLFKRLPVAESDPQFVAEVQRALVQELMVSEDEAAPEAAAVVDAQGEPVKPEQAAS